jgi:5'(3')-deoxyribonucleotidase
MINNILCDMDGVLVDFMSSCLPILNKELKKNITIQDYVNKQHGFYIEKAYDISQDTFWEIINKNNGQFWYELKPFPWAKDLYDYLCDHAEVTIATSPVRDPVCYSLKVRWLSYYLDIDNKDVMIGSKKHLMANSNHLLVDDYPKNVTNFIKAGGQGVCVPSNWNTHDLSFDKIKDAIDLCLDPLEELL